MTSPAENAALRPNRTWLRKLGAGFLWFIIVMEMVFSALLLIPSLASYAAGALIVIMIGAPEPGSCAFRS